ncbi:hypothetical protein JCM16303_001819 [Sporobolomyces ruberrimus]
MLRAPLRTLPRRLPTPVTGHRFISESTYRKASVYQSQTSRPIVVASLGLAALFGWTAAILTVGGKRDKKGAVEKVKEKVKEVVPESLVPSSSSSSKASASTSTSPSTESAPAPSAANPSSPTAPEEENSQAAAFNPETGEINWDCPCLGGMADGPCGEDFKQAFSCFVYSEAEPKGVDCVEKFRNMQECFRKHPDIYGNDAEDIDDEDADEYDLITRAEAALALPDEHFLEKVAEAVDEATPSK